LRGLGALDRFDGERILLFARELELTPRTAASPNTPMALPS
jgi:hypothetical protein